MEDFLYYFFSFTARVRRLVFYDSNNDDKDGDAGMTTTRMVLVLHGLVWKRRTEMKENLRMLHVK